jgi:hypothetical protein
VNRLGIAGFDGGRVTTRIGRSGVDAEGYVGFGLARATALPVTNPVLDPLDEFQPRSRQILAGAAVGYRSPLGDMRVDYQREVDRESRNFVSERAAVSLDLSPVDRWSVTAGVEYDLANTWFGNVEGSIRYTTAWLTALAGLRQYRPHFDLWTIWGAFSPVPYHAANTAVHIRPLRAVELRGRYERYSYVDTETLTPLVDVDDDGWRLGLGITYTPVPAWRLDAGYREEFGPGASSEGFEGSVTWLPDPALSLTAYGSTLDRPLEFRFEDASVEVIGFDVDWEPGDRLAFGAGLARFAEERDRPDAAAFDWNQTRLHARATLFFRSEADVLPLPAPIRGRRTGLR